MARIPPQITSRAAQAGSPAAWRPVARCLASSARAKRRRSRYWPVVYESPGYDPLTDLVPITRLGVGPLLLAVHKGVPANSVMDLLSLARARPGELSFCTPGIGTPGHLVSGLLMHLTGIQATHVPYKSGAQAALDLVAGHMTWTIEGYTS